MSIEYPKWDTSGMANKVPQTEAELQEHYEDQLGFLQVSAEAFDKGAEAEAKRLASSLRILLARGGRNMHPLLGQLGMLDRPFISTVPKHIPSRILTANLNLVGVNMQGAQHKYFAQLDSGGIFRELPFDEWWTEPVFAIPRGGSTLSRENLVRSVADQDGGAHVDPALEEPYASFSRQNSLGHTRKAGAEAEALPMLRPERAAIRQIAHEVLKSLLPDYVKSIEHKGASFCSVSLELPEGVGQ